MDVLLTDFIQPDLQLEHEVASRFGLTLHEPSQQCRSEYDVIESAQGFEAIIAQEAPITRKVFEELHDLRIVSMPQVGTNSIDLDAAREHGVWVTNVPDANATEVACHATAMALSLVRRLPQFDASVRAGEWDYTAAGPLVRPRDLTLATIGLGRIGRLFIDYAGPCFGKLVAYDPFVKAEQWPGHIERCETLDTLLPAADVISIHMPLTKETTNMIDSKRLQQMKQGAILINVSRGPIVDMPALMHALDSGHIASAALDVLPTEPPDPTDPVLTHEKVMLSPHAAFYSIQSDEESRFRSVETIAALASTGRPNNVVVEGRRA